MFVRNLVFVCLLSVSSASAALSQAPGEASLARLPFTLVPLTVEEGFPLEVMLTQKTKFKLDEPVRGTVIEPVYAFDREVIPAGAEVLGKVTGFGNGGKWKKISALIGGDFTPVREPQITFDTLVMPNGTHIPIETSAAYGSNVIVRSSSGTEGSDKALTLIPQPRTQSLIKGMLWNLSPYRPQSLAMGTHYQVTLTKPVQFGPAVVATGALDAIGSEPPPSSVLHARLVTAMDSRQTKEGTAVQAVLTRPLYSSDNLLIFPAGARIEGEVVHVQGARKLHRAGELFFKFTRIEPPNSLLLVKWMPQQIDGRLSGAQVANDLIHMRIGQDGTTKIVESKERFFAPAMGFFLSGLAASRNFGASGQPFDRALTGAYSNSLLKRVVGSSSGFGLPGSIAGKMIPPVGIGLWSFSVGKSVFTNFLGRGQEIKFPVNTAIEIRLQPAEQF